MVAKGKHPAVQKRVLSPIQQATNGTILRIQQVGDQNWSYGWQNKGTGEYTGRDGYSSEVEALNQAIKSIEGKLWI